MTNEERDIISQFIARIGGLPLRRLRRGRFSAGDLGGAAAPGGPRRRRIDRATVPALPGSPVPDDATGVRAGARADPGTDRIAADGCRTATDAARPCSRHSSNRSSRKAVAGFSAGLFGGRQQAAPPPNPGPWGGQQGTPPVGSRPAAPRKATPPPPSGYQPPPPAIAPGYQPGMFQRSGSGFLGLALTTAAGVAGGMVVGNMLEPTCSPAVTTVVAGVTRPMVPRRPVLGVLPPLRG